jgi:Zn-dependent protease with chaperone function
MKPPKKKRGHKYRLVTSLSAATFAVLLLAFYGSKHHDPMPPVAGFWGAILLAVIMFAAWEIVVMFRRAGQRAREREAADRAASRRGFRGRRYARQGR